MPNLENQNDQTRLKRIIEILEHIDNFEFQTELGQEFHNTMKQALNEIIKPTARDCYKKLI